MEQIPVSDAKEEPTVEITTDGKTIKPFLNSLSEIVGECKLEFREDCITVEAVNAVNVVAIELELPAEELTSYSVTETTVGVDVSSLKGLVRRARTHSDDSLHLRVSPKHISSTVTRGYDSATVITDDTMRTIDPDSVRERPDIPDKESLAEDYYSLTLDSEAFDDGFTHVVEQVDPIEFTSENGGFVVQDFNEEDIESAARFQNKGHETDASTLMSQDMFRQSMDAITKAKADTVTIHYANEHPVFIDFTRESDGEQILSGTVMQAPRLAND